MKVLIATVGLVGLSVIGSHSAEAADMDYSQSLGLIVSGSYESWVGGTVIGDVTANDSNLPEDDFHFVSGGEARLSFPLGDNLSIQQDVKYELNSEMLWRDDDAQGVDDYYGFQWQATTHLSFLRDPSQGLFGIFGGFGGGKVDGDPTTAWFVGGEFQLYMDDWTFHGQAGYFDAAENNDEDNGMMRDAVFGRGVARWYMTPDNRLQFDVAYADGTADEADNGPDDHFLVEWGVRFDTILEALPVIGDTNVFLRYRGNYVENSDGFAGDDDDDVDNEHFSDHTFMVGTSWTFGGTSRQEHERIGVALDSPDIVRWSQSGETID